MTRRMSLVAGVLAAATLLTSCALVSDGSEGSGDAHVTQAVMTAQINDQGQAVGAARVFPSTVQRIFAVLNLEGVKPGVEIVGKWYQTSTQDVPPEGSEVHSSGIKLDEKTAAEGRSRVALFLPATSRGIPEDSWILRVYANGDLIRTMAFVVISPTGTTAPVPTPAAPAASPAAATSYTVVSGDTLQTIAQRFKPAAEDLNVFVGRIRTTNSLTSDNLSVGQVLRIPN